MTNVSPSILRSVHLYLMDLAMQGKRTTYEEIALACDLPSQGNQLGYVLSPVLGEIFRFCQRRQQPILTSIVIRKSGQDAGLPGRGFWSLLASTMDSSYGDLENPEIRRYLTDFFQEQVFRYWQHENA